VMPPGDRVLAHCFPWRQLAANHHDHSVVSESVVGQESGVKCVKHGCQARIGIFLME
jgi:hypothetical protein